MNNLSQSLWVEFLKARRSKMPVLTALGFSLAPIVGGLFMIILRDPEFARRAGLISAKAQIAAGSADWQTYLGLLAQAEAIGGIILFGLIATWVFGREFADRTVKDWLALPTARAAIVASKLIVVAAWTLALSALNFGIGLIIGNAVALAPAPIEIFWRGGITLAITALLTIALVTPIVFFASAGRGYLPPMGITILLIIFAQILAAMGWGEYFPWSVPALFAGVAGEHTAQLGASSFVIVALTSVAGIIATFVWWERADQQ
ncbi:MAG: ABC transporter permease [Chloroflexi bacterium]|nr:ABC transporter permease [Chloroflexota bacterium]